MSTMFSLDFTNGLDANAASPESTTSRHHGLDNWRFAGPNCVRTRPGFTRTHVTPFDDPVTSIAHFHPPDGSPQHQLAFTAGGSLYWRHIEQPDFTPAWQFDEPSPLPWRFVYIDDLLICFAPVPEQSIAYDGEQILFGPFLPSARQFTIHQSRIAAANLPDHPNRIVFSDPHTANAWFPNSYMDFGTGTDPITALAVLAGTLYVFQPNAIWAMHGHEITSWTVDLISNSFGCTAPDSIEVIDAHIYFVHNDRVYRFDGITFELVSDPVAPLLPHASVLRSAKAASSDTHYYLAYADATPYNNAILVYDSVRAAWTRDTDPNVLTFAVMKPERAPIVLAYDPIRSFIYQLETGPTDDGSPVVSTFTSHRLATEPRRTVQLRSFAVDLDNGAGADIGFTLTATTPRSRATHTVEAAGARLPSHLWADELVVSGSIETDAEPVTLTRIDIDATERARPR